ncbi:hypothetical protein UMZ34_00415 [Halopseudomonas pachastrellae]|nr:hypothetical protein UMZ34_00415 [Halopseudomonas pachastrellae]
MITRIAQTPSASAIYRAQVGSLIVEALPVNYDQNTFAAEFKRNGLTTRPLHCPTGSASPREQT